jgi:hypothetical protein
VREVEAREEGRKEGRKGKTHQLQKVNRPYTVALLLEEAPVFRFVVSQ